MRHLLLLLVISVGVATFALNFHRPNLFYVTCMHLQAVTLLGIAVSSPILIQVGHIGFAASLYVGAFYLSHPDTLLVISVCIITLITRRVLVRGCPFDIVANGPIIRIVPPIVTDLYYSCPIVVIVYRMLFPF